MTEKANRKDLIVQAAGELFRRHGYSATSVRQIADEVGCTEAALYYHFKDGKRGLFREVVECNLPNLLAVVEMCEHATSLYGLVKCFGTEIARGMPQRAERLRWLLADFPNMSPEERALIHERHLGLHSRLSELIGRFVPDDRDAAIIAWTIINTMFGYVQLFHNMDVRSVADVPFEDIVERLARSIAGGV